MSLVFLLDLLALLTALTAAYLWFRASSYQVRRVSKSEDINSLDLNRIVTAINRTQLLNRRAALATALSALIIALKFAHDMLTR
ncbi:MAG: hypothetical protein IOC52_14920 [Methylobacterium sp.]|nr:hypothetical protein [Methylobacterium sp.]MCA3625453.1 hypothetical protein [Methylobacterium sp.]MCA3626555.1 hypothetical protein [Methylobacterium sp.]